MSIKQFGPKKSPQAILNSSEYEIWPPPPVIATLADFGADPANALAIFLNKKMLRNIARAFAGSASKSARVSVTGGGGQISYSLLFRIACGDFLGPNCLIDL